MARIAHRRLRSRYDTPCFGALWAIKRRLLRLFYLMRLVALLLPLTVFSSSCIRLRSPHLGSVWLT